MKRFQFRFDAIRRLADQGRDEARLRLAEAQKALGIIDQRINEIAEQQDSLRSEVTGSLVGQISVDALLHRGRYGMQIEIEHRDLLDQRKQIEAEIDRRRGRLTLAEQECRKFERLKEIALEQHAQEQLKYEQAELDEMASHRPRTPRGDME